MCGVVDLQVSRLGVCVCLAPSLDRGPRGALGSVRGNVGAVARRGVYVSPRARARARVCVCVCTVRVCPT